MDAGRVSPRYNTSHLRRSNVTGQGAAPRVLASPGTDRQTVDMSNEALYLTGPTMLSVVDQVNMTLPLKQCARLQYYWWTDVIKLDQQTLYSETHHHHQELAHT